MPDFTAWGPADWSAVASFLTVIVALAASSIALRQVREARRLREEQAQPYVVAFMEPSEASPQIIDLVVRNFGTTAATSVTLQSDPVLQRTSEGSIEDVWLFDELPTLVPGQEWRTMWDFGPERSSADLPERHRVTMAYRDSRNRKMKPTESILDWGAFKGRMWVNIYGVHHAAKALRDIDKKLGKWQEGVRGGVAVYVRDGDKRDEALQRRLDERAHASQTDSDASDVSAE
ncbi:hypothetical protein [Cryptosporangium phraense]|uniref:Uncharacterized protein n=1 Tax=Cryptosporangium phraense TaxID=2593070 RepID=A0A545AX31_9ACTN|nr:hypothetical protein [Cryptosporangium phraense]TQS45886.1 hypothetical protein FL583_05115 [Cryptosporangium phraense]